MVQRWRGMLVVLCALLLSAPVRPIAAQQTVPVPVVYAETADGITLYALSSPVSNSLEMIGHLPQEFNPTSSDSWRIRNNLVRSPGNRHVAFTAQKGSYEEGHVALYLYSLKDQTVQQVFEEAYNGVFFHLKWSPFSRFLLIEPEIEDNCGCGDWPEVRVYDLESGVLHALTDTDNAVYGNGFIWLSDSRRLGYVDNGVKIVSRDGSQRQTLVDHTVDPPPQSIDPATCDLAWSEVSERLYYVAGCLRLVDDPLNVLYSVDLNGNRRIEADLPEILRNEFTLPAENDPYVEDVDVVQIHLRGSTYVAFGFKALAQEGSDPASGVDLKAFWRVIGLRAPGQIETLFEFTAPELALSSLSGAVFAPDQKKAALVDAGHVVIGDLIEGTLLMRVKRTLEHYFRRIDVFWIDNEQLLYAADDDVWLMDTFSGRTTNLTADVAGTAFLLPQTNSY